MDRRTFLGAALVSLASPAIANQRMDALQAGLEAIRASAGIPALGGAILTPDGIAWSGVSGVMRNGAADPVSAASRWHLGSNTKAMTAALYARLVEQGRAAWGASLDSLFPDIDADAAWHAVTVEQVLAHRGGVLDSAVMPGWMLAAWAGQDRPALRTTLARSVLGAAPAGPVGAFSYSNANYIVVGAAIERITGGPWEDAMQREVFGPLGMASAGFGAPTGDEPWGHQGTAMTPKDPVTIGSDNPPAMGPAGMVHASIEDYAQFLRVFLTDGGGWLSGDSVRRLTTSVEGPGQPYALGWGVAQAPWSGDRPALIHDGSNTMWLARAVVAPGRRAAAICVANAGDPAAPAIDALTRALIEAFPA